VLFLALGDVRPQAPHHAAVRRGLARPLLGLATARVPEEQQSLPLPEDALLPLVDDLLRARLLPAVVAAVAASASPLLLLLPLLLELELLLLLMLLRVLMMLRPSVASPLLLLLLRQKLLLLLLLLLLILGRSTDPSNAAVTGRRNHTVRTRPTIRHCSYARTPTDPAPHHLLAGLPPPRHHHTLHRLSPGSHQFPPLRPLQSHRIRGPRMRRRSAGGGGNSDGSRRRRRRRRSRFGIRSTPHTPTRRNADADATRAHWDRPDPSPPYLYLYRGTLRSTRARRTVRATAVHCRRRTSPGARRAGLGRRQRLAVDGDERSVHRRPRPRRLAVAPRPRWCAGGGALAGRARPTRTARPAGAGARLLCRLGALACELPDLASERRRALLEVGIWGELSE
jgi:hypothetical protein